MDCLSYKIFLLHVHKSFAFFGFSIMHFPLLLLHHYYMLCITMIRPFPHSVTQLLTNLILRMNPHRDRIGIRIARSIGPIELFSRASSVWDDFSPVFASPALLPLSQILCPISQRCCWPLPRIRNIPTPTVRQGLKLLCMRQLVHSRSRYSQLWCFKA